MSINPELEKKWKILEKVHVKRYAMYAMILSIVVSIIVLLVILWNVVLGPVDWIFLGISAAIIICSILALFGNCLNLHCLFIPYLALTLVLNSILIAIFFYCIAMAATNPEFWQRWLRNTFWTLQQPIPSSKLANDTFWLAICFVVISFLLLCMFTFSGAILQRTRAFMKTPRETNANSVETAERTQTKRRKSRLNIFSSVKRSGVEPTTITVNDQNSFVNAKALIDLYREKNAAKLSKS